VAEDVQPVPSEVDRRGLLLHLDDLGESPFLSEWLVVAPSLGRFSPADVQLGQNVATGQKIGHIAEGTDEVPVIAHSSGLFIAWMVFDGERVARGRPLGRFSRGEEER
jgi:biotin carboxyl carrier protein